MKNQKGITLIALIITIIVMLILAGVAISMAIGDNGVISQAESTTERQKYAVAEEKIRTQSEFITEGENVGEVDLNKTLSNIEQLQLEEIDYDNIILESNVLTIPFKDGKKIEIDGVSEEVAKEKYYYSTEFSIEGGTLAEAVVIVKDGEGDQKEVLLYFAYGGKYIYFNENRTFIKKTYTEDTIIENIVDIKSGETVLLSGDEEEGYMLKGENFYFLDGKGSAEFKLTSLNSEIKNIIENAIAM